MNRATMFGNRMLRVNGGHTKPIYFVIADYLNSDLDRGIRGTENLTFSELIPRPTLKLVTTEQMTKLSDLLQIGDYNMQIAGDQILDSSIVNKEARVKVGGGNTVLSDGDVFDIVHFDPIYLAANVSYYDVFIRGILSLP